KPTSNSPALSPPNLWLTPSPPTSTNATPSDEKQISNLLSPIPHPRMLTFANPAFLWGLLGLTAPILIHLINRDLSRPLFFPSVRFIMRGKMPVDRKRRLRDLLLLALRLLLFAAII